MTHRRYHDLTTKGDDYALKADRDIHHARGSERPGIYATLANMYITRARLEYDKLVAKALNTRLATLAARVREHDAKILRIEAHLRLTEHDEPPTPADLEPSDDDDFELLFDDDPDDDDDDDLYFVPLPTGGALLFDRTDRP